MLTSIAVVGAGLSARVDLPRDHETERHFQTDFSRWHETNRSCRRHPMDPAQIEEALGQRGSERTREVGAPLRPVQAAAGQRTPALSQSVQVDAEALEATDAV